MTIPFIFETPSGYQISQQAKDFLNSLDANTPLSIICVAGRYRTGKSYFINKVLLNGCLAEKSCPVGNSINACTKGLNMFPELIEQNGKFHLVLDTEGLNSMEVSKSHDSTVLLLSLLCSSQLIYNSVGTLDENTLNEIGYNSIILTAFFQFLNFKLHAKFKHKLNSRLITLLAKKMENQTQWPSLLWVVRDFALQLTDSNGDAISPKQYLEKTLENQKVSLISINISQGVSETVQKKNDVRRKFKEMFVNRDCALLVRPIEDECLLQNLNAVEDSQLRPEFLAQIHKLSTKIFQKVMFSLKTPIKELNGKQLNGPMYLTVCQQYCDALNSGAVPTVQNTWFYVLKNQAQEVLLSFIPTLPNTISQYLSSHASQNELVQQISAITCNVMKQFNSLLISPCSDKTVIQHLESQIKKEVKTLNKKLLTQKLQSQTLEMHRVIQEMEEITFDNYKSVNFDQFEKEIQADAQKLIREVLLRKFNDNEIRLNKNISHLERELTDEKQKSQNLQQMQENFNEKIKDQKQMLSLDVKNLESANIRIENEKETLLQQMLEIKTINQDLQSEISQLQIQIDANYALMNQEKQYMQKIIQQLEQQIQNQKQQQENQNQLLFENQEHMKQILAEKDAIQDQNKSLERELQKAQINKIEMQQKMESQDQQSKIKNEQTEQLNQDYQIVKQDLKELANNYKFSTKEAQINLQNLSDIIDNQKKQLKIQDRQLYDFEKDRQIQISEQQQLYISLQKELIQKDQSHLETINALQVQFSYEQRTVQQQKLHLQSQKEQIQCLSQQLFSQNQQNHHKLADLPHPSPFRRKFVHTISIPNILEIKTATSSPENLYTIKLETGDTFLTVQRTYNQFIELHYALTEQFPCIEFPKMTNSYQIYNGQLVMEGSRKSMEQYLQGLNANHEIKNSPVFQKFIGLQPGTNKQQPRPLSQERIAHTATPENNFNKENHVRNISFSKLGLTYNPNMQPSLDIRKKLQFQQTNQ